MSRNVLFAMTISSLLGGGVIGGCGEEAETGGGSNGGANEGEGEGDLCKTGPTITNCDNGEGEGSSNEGEGEGGVVPPGADGEPCGGPAKNECQDGYECLSCDEADVTRFDSGDPCEDKVCTCPQWFEGRWWAEFDVRAVEYEYDFSRNELDREFTMDQEIVFNQNGCRIVGPDAFVLFYDDSIGRVEPPPHGFYYELGWRDENETAHPLVSRGALSEDHNTLTGTCEGEYLDNETWVRDGVMVWFRLQCDFTLARR